MDGKTDWYPNISRPVPTQLLGICEVCTPAAYLSQLPSLRHLFTAAEKPRGERESSEISGPFRRGSAKGGAL